MHTESKKQAKRNPRCNGGPISEILIKKRVCSRRMRPIVQTDSRPNPRCLKARTLWDPLNENPENTHSTLERRRFPVGFCTSAPPGGAWTSTGVSMVQRSRSGPHGPKIMSCTNPRSTLAHPLPLFQVHICPSPDSFSYLV